MCYELVLYLFYKFWPEALLQDTVKWEKQVEYLYHNIEGENK